MLLLLVASALCCEGMGVFASLWLDSSHTIFQMHFVIQHLRLLSQALCFKIHEVYSLPIHMNYTFLHLLPGLLIMARLPINPLLSSDTAQASGSVAGHELAYSSLANSVRAQMLRPPSYWNTHGSY